MSFLDTLSVARPEVFLALASLVLLLVGAFAAPRGATLVSWLAAGALLFAAYLAATAPMGAIFNGGFVGDAASRFAKVGIYGMSAVGVILGSGWLSRLKAHQFEFPVLIVIAAVGMGMMASAGDLISLYVGVELQSLALYVLAAFRRDDAKASEAGLKYFVLGALSSGLLLYGASLIYGFAGSVRFTDIAAAAHAGVHNGVIFGLVFLIAGLGFKVSAAPFHMWTPDVYEGAPTPVVGFFGAAPKFAAMVLFARALGDAFPGAVDQWRSIIIILAVASMLLGAFAGLAQKNLKRLWAYSSIANVGYALVGLSAGSAEGYQSMLVFMVLYMVDVTGFFACLTALTRDGKPMETLEDMAGLMRERPGIALALTAFAISAIGFPPFSGFIGKVFVFRAIIDAGYSWVAVVGLVSSVVSAFYYLRLIKVMWFDATPGATDAPPVDARVIAYAAALFTLPVVILAMKGLDPLSKVAAAAFGLS
ncbi:MAG: NADH-quinone oxidoreductase subunit NuoN [Caulobacteraceae bacterium]|nr:NADH-quinone oxidoreductase subunit NuoN [Caulobacteraceae bacterium]